MTRIKPLLRNLIFVLIWLDFALMYYASAVLGDSPLTLMALILMVLVSLAAIFAY